MSSNQTSALVYSLERPIRDQHTGLKSLADATAVVPNLRHLEVVNVLEGAVRSGDLDTKRIGTLYLSRSHNLSSYDAAYLELALREGLPLATLDKHLLKAARSSDVAVYLQ